MVGAAVVRVMANRRKDSEARESAAAHENSTLEARVQELTNVMAGSPATRFSPAQPGVVERFGLLEQTVETHGAQLVAIQAGIARLEAK